MTVKFVMFPSLGRTVELTKEISPGMTVQEFEDQLLESDDVTLNEAELMTAACSVDGIFVDRDQVLTGDEKEINYVLPVMNGC